jgi:hypothetical protein
VRSFVIGRSYELAPVRVLKVQNFPQILQEKSVQEKAIAARAIAEAKKEQTIWL